MLAVSLSVVSTPPGATEGLPAMQFSEVEPGEEMTWVRLDDQFCQHPKVITE